MLRNLHSIGYLILVIKLLIILIVCPQGALTVPYHHDFEFEPEADKTIFYDSNILPESKEVSKYLLLNRSEKVLFIPQGNNTPIYIVITPCASAVEWTVSHKSIVPTNENEDSSNSLGFNTVIPKTKTLYSYAGRDQHKFELESGEMGFYTVDIKSTESDSYVKFYGTTFRPGIYPKLPPDSTVKTKKVKRKSITFEWIASPEMTPFDNLIEYAVAVNRKRPYQTHCSVMAHLNGDKKPRPPKNAGFMFPSETERDKILRENAAPISPVRKGEIFYRHVGRKTRLTFNSARPGRKYIINVYAINIKTNRTSAYQSIEVRTRKVKKAKKTKRLKDGRMEIFSLDKPKKTVTYHYKTKKPKQNMLLAIHVCSGKVNIKVSSKGKKQIFRKRVKGYKTFILKDLPKDKYFIAVTNSRKGKGSVRLFVSKRPEKFQYPKLPKETKLKALNTTCNNVTIAWEGETDRQTFCIYKTELSASVRKKRRRSRYEQCVEETDKNSELVECVNFRHHKSKPLLQKVISGLKPNSVYKIDIHVKRRGKQQKLTSLKYESLQVRTLDDGC
ncbi:hypothetical protein FSP39_001741 [Pinctada imbricata]|uniref:Protein NDNF n=1 Tax=Pinctada imbricata TaxID=66713 RepID=A0AA88XNF0_PINIB|nr:hypothetical protein FSP39_001741 [Pinctada imbricata]